MSHKKIFISYRRQDTAGEAGRLADSLKQNYDASQIFMDIDTIEPGVDFVDVINRAVSSCEVLLAIIGPAWVHITDARENRRLDDPHDFIRLEISSALKRNIRVIPVLVDGAKMPVKEDLPSELKDLSRRNAHEISNTRWAYDVEQLLKILYKVIGPPANAKKDPKPIHRSSKSNSKVPLLIVGLLIAFTITFIILNTEDDTYNPDVTQQAIERSSLGSSSEPASETMGKKSTPTRINTEETIQEPSQETEAQESYQLIEGTWTESSGSYFVMEQEETYISLTEYNAFDVEVGYADGNIRGNQVLLDYSNTLLGISANINLTLSANGRELSGKITENSSGTVMPLYYTKFQ